MGGGGVGGFNFHILILISIVKCMFIFVQCFNLAEKMEEDIDEWYYNNQDQPIMNYICRDRVLKNKDKSMYICNGCGK